MVLFANDEIKKQKLNSPFYVSVVEPDITSFKCIQCGNCEASNWIEIPDWAKNHPNDKFCKHYNYRKQICQNYENRWDMCKAFPFRTLMDDNGVCILYIYKCNGYMRGDKPLSLFEIKAIIKQLCEFAHEPWGGLTVYDVK